MTSATHRARIARARRFPASTERLQAGAPMDDPLFPVLHP